MSLREKIIQNPRVGLGAACALLIISIGIIALQLRGPALPAATAQAFFTVDDGKTWFADDLAKLPPFDKDGKEAVRAYVYRCPDGTQFVNYLERFKPSAKQALASMVPADAEHKGTGSLSAIQGAYTAGREVKRPGDKKWIDGGNFREAAQITIVKCPNGSAEATAVDP
jgi:hypothetical protein